MEIHIGVMLCWHGIEMKLFVIYENIIAIRMHQIDLNWNYNVSLYNLDNGDISGWLYIPRHPISNRQATDIPYIRMSIGDQLIT